MRGKEKKKHIDLRLEILLNNISSERIERSKDNEDERSKINEQMENIRQDDRTMKRIFKRRVFR